MEVNFVSDISSILLEKYDKKEYTKIYDDINNEILFLDGSMNYDSAYRLQQDIALLNTSILSDISKYINSNNSPPIDNKKMEKSTFEAQSKTTKINLYYKYIYLIVKLIIIFTLLGIIYFNLFSSYKNKSSFSNPVSMLTSTK